VRDCGAASLPLRRLVAHEPVYGSALTLWERTLCATDLRSQDAI